jgi:hypothetical protein
MDSYRELLNPEFGAGVDQQQSITMKRNLLKTVITQVDNCEKLILILMGENSERLIEIYSIRSSIDFNSGVNLQRARSLQKKANKLILDAHGELSTNYVLRLFESVSATLEGLMVAKTRDQVFVQIMGEMTNDSETAARLAK